MQISIPEPPILREKKDHSFYPNIELKCLNQCVVYQQFNLEGIPVLAQLVQRND